MSREEIMEAIKKCTEELGHVPSLSELRDTMKVNKRALRKKFGTYTGALRACGLERHGSGYEVTRKALFLDWAGVARQLGKVPSITDYEIQGEYSIRPMVRCFRSWRLVPAGMLEYARKEGMEGEWKDVMDIIARHLGPGQRDGRRSMQRGGAHIRARILTDQPMYGTPLAHPMMSHAPTNESAVLLLFGAEAQRLGFKILRTQAECPDCEAMREVEPERWQRVRIEFEYESRNFLAHDHRLESCDLIVCWSHNWPDCPLEVLELRTIVEGNQGGAAEAKAPASLDSSTRP